MLASIDCSSIWKDIFGQSDFGMLFEFFPSNHYFIHFVSDKAAATALIPDGLLPGISGSGKTEGAGGADKYDIL